MEELIDLIATDGSPSDTTDKIKEILYAKAFDNIHNLRPYVASSLFGNEIEDNYSEEDYSEEQE